MNDWDRTPCSEDHNSILERCKAMIPSLDEVSAKRIPCKTTANHSVLCFTILIKMNRVCYRIELNSIVELRTSLDGFH